MKVGRSHRIHCNAFAQFLRIDGLRDTSTVVILARTMNRPPTSGVEYGPEGFQPVHMRHALEVLPDRGIGALVIERRSSTPIAHDDSCRPPAARPRSGR